MPSDLGLEEREAAFLRPPSLCTRLYGQEQAEAVFLDAWRKGRRHHAWLLCGERGIGKASFAYCAARFVLAGGVGDSLSARCDSSLVRMVADGVHPDCMAIQAETGEIPVDKARAFVRFLHKTPVFSAYRVGIVDSADRLNKEASNALLKVVEEPGSRVVLFLPCHRFSAISVTLRSRCRPLYLRSLSCASVEAGLVSSGLAQSLASRLALLSGGSLYYAGLLSVLGEDFLSAFAKALGGSRAELVRVVEKEARAGEAARFLWQRLLVLAARSDVFGEGQGEGEEEGEGVGLFQLEERVRRSLRALRWRDWLALWTRSVPMLLESRLARGLPIAAALESAFVQLAVLQQGQ